MRKPPALLFPLALILALSSCTSTIWQYRRLEPRFAVEGVRAVALLPFAAPEEGGDPLSPDAAFLRLGRGRHFLSGAEKAAVEGLESLMRQMAWSEAPIVVRDAGSELPDGRSRQDFERLVLGADAYVTGQVRRVSTSISYDSPSKEKDKAALPWFSREVAVDYVYRLVRSADGTVLGETWNSVSAKDAAQGDKAQAKVKSEEVLAREAVREARRTVLRDFSKVEESGYLYFEYELRDLKANDVLRAAEILASSGNLTEALLVCDSLFSRTRSFITGYDKAVIQVMAGDLRGAGATLAEIEAIPGVEGDRRVPGSLARLADLIASRETEARWTPVGTAR